MSRFWTQFEAWLACQMITDEGLIGAGPTDRRCKVTCIRGARDLDEMESTLFKMWRYRTPQEAHAVLVSPDVTVTNQRDKNAQLPKILTLATQVKCCRLGQRLLRQRRQAHRRQHRWCPAQVLVPVLWLSAARLRRQARPDAQGAQSDARIFRQHHAGVRRR